MSTLTCIASTSHTLVWFYGA